MMVDQWVQQQHHHHQRCRSHRRHISQEAHDPNSLLHEGFGYAERRGSAVVPADPLLPDDRGRRHLTMAGSATEEFRPCRRVLTPGFSGAKQAHVQGLARVEPSPRVTPRPTGFRTNAEALRRSGYDVPDPGLVLQSKHVVMDDTGRPAKERFSGELTLEKAFGLKRKLNSQREKRGGVPAKANPGDKLFHHVDYSPGFHQKGGLIVGSSFYRTRTSGGTHTDPEWTARPAPIPERVGYALAYRKPNMTFHEARQASLYVEDLKGVLKLTEAAPAPVAAVGQEEGASWEERTGMHTWRKKDRSLPSTTAPGSSGEESAGC